MALSSDQLFEFIKEKSEDTAFRDAHGAIEFTVKATLVGEPLAQALNAAVSMAQIEAHVQDAREHRGFLAKQHTPFTGSFGSGVPTDAGGDGELN